MAMKRDGVWYAPGGVRITGEQADRLDGKIAHLPTTDPAAEAVSALRERDERTSICSALGCIDKPGVPLKFVQDLQRRLAESYARNDELIRSWDRASPTERQELDRMRRGWGPSSPTERAHRQMDVAACVQALGGALTELSVPEEAADDVPEEAQAYLDAAYDRVEKAYAAAVAVSHAIRDEPDEWPDIKAAEERGALVVEADNAALRTERDEARADASLMKDLVDQASVEIARIELEREGCAALAGSALAENMVVRFLNDRLSTERDEARRERDQWKCNSRANRDDSQRNADNLTRVEAERDVLTAEVERLKAALSDIADQCPATCEMTVAHMMADTAARALKTEGAYDAQV